MMPSYREAPVGEAVLSRSAADLCNEVESREVEAPVDAVWRKALAGERALRAECAVELEAPELDDISRRC